MKKLSLIAGAGIFQTASILAAPSAPSTPLEKVFYQAAWNEFAEGIAMDLGDPSLVQELEAGTFRTEMFKAIGADKDSFTYSYRPYTIDSMPCVNMQITDYNATFNIKEYESNMYGVTLKDMDVRVESLQAEGCPPKL